MPKPLPASDRRLNRGMTVADLIEVLQDCDPEARVMFACDYGDISHTQQVLPVDEAADLSDLEGSYLADSGYSRSGVSLETELDDDDMPEPAYSDDECPAVVILR